MTKRLIEAITKWQQNSKAIALATVIKVYGSAPQPLGSQMAVNEDLEFEGSVSGGCVEGDVIQQATRVIQTGLPKLVEYGISDDTAWGLGLACGGMIEIFIEPFDPIHQRMFDLIQSKSRFSVVTVLNGNQIGKKWVILPSEDRAGVEGAIAIAADTTMQKQMSAKMRVNIQGEDIEIFCAVFLPPARLMIIGAVHIAIPLINLGNQFGFTTIVMDARSAFATKERFPHADQLFVDWPADALQKLTVDENTYLVFLSHDEKMDNPALAIALKSKARYIGALGSSKTHSKRVETLLKSGVPDNLIQRIHAPIGLNIGASGANEIALAIMAEIIAVRNGKST